MNFVPDHSATSVLSDERPFESFANRLSSVSRIGFCLAAKSMWEFDGTAAQLIDKVNSLGIIVERTSSKKQNRATIKVKIKGSFAQIEVTDNRFRRLIETADGTFTTRPIVIRARIASTLG